MPKFYKSVQPCLEAAQKSEFRITFFLSKRYKRTISKWLEYALARKVESSELNFLLQGFIACDVDKAFDFDGFLKLNSEKAANVADPDKCLDFRSLKSLSLKAVKVTAEAIYFILRNCPFLERLEVVGSVKLDNLVISDPELVLQYLHIDHCQQLKSVSISNINLVSLNIKLNIGIRGVRLTNLPMLVELSILSFGAREELRNVFSQSFSCLSQLESLTITAVNLQDITQLSKVARLTKLKRLVLKVGAWPDERLIELVSFIQACPCLEEFVLMLTRHKINFVMAYGTVSQPEICSLKCLKVFKFGGYYGRAGDLELVMHVLGNTAVLEKIVIDPCNPFSHPGSPFNHAGRTVEEEEESRIIAHQQFEGLRESVQPRVIIL